MLAISVVPTFYEPVIKKQTFMSSNLLIYHFIKLKIADYLVVPFLSHLK